MKTRDAYYKEQWNREKAELYISELENQYEDLLEEIKGIVDWHDVGKLKTKLFGG